MNAIWLQMSNQLSAIKTKLVGWSLYTVLRCGEPEGKFNKIFNYHTSGLKLNIFGTRTGLSTRAMYLDRFFKHDNKRMKWAGWCSCTSDSNRSLCELTVSPIYEAPNVSNRLFEAYIRSQELLSICVNAEAPNDQPGFKKISLSLNMFLVRSKSRSPGLKTVSDL